MSIQKLCFFTLGLALAASPALATISYQSSQAAFASKAVTTDSLFVSSLTTFTGILATDGVVSGDEYVDATTGIEFIAFNGSGSSQVAFSSVSGGVLNTTVGAGNAIEVVFPSSTDYGFAFNFTTASGTGVTVCVDLSPGTFSNCALGGTFVSQNGTGFIGGINDGGSLAPLTTLWIHPQNGASGATDLQSFEVATQGSATPETSTMLLIGSGLVAISALSINRRRHARER